jgi:GNAT superfamily N-acetyltransferase
MIEADIKIRELRTSEIDFLQDALYEAIYIAESKDKLPRSIIEQAELNRYISNFGRKNDFCLVAEQNGYLVGAIWIRIFSESEKGYGYVDEFTPELSMAVLDGNRNKGIGKQLLKSMIRELEKRPYEQISLSVSKENFAHEFYKKYGFVDYHETKDSITMTRKNAR